MERTADAHPVEFVDEPPPPTFGGRRGRGRMKAIGLGLLMGLCAADAMAQLSTEAPARARTVPVAEQVKDESEHPRFRLGPFRMRRVFGLRDTGYNNNVFGTQENKVADWTVTAFAGVKYLLPTGPKTYLRGVVVPEYTWYNKLSSYRAFGGTYSAALLGLYNRMSVELGGSGQRTLAIVNSETQQLARQDSLGGGLKLEVEILRRLSLYAGLQGARLRFDDSGFPVSDFNAVTDLNRTEIAGRGGVRYRFSEVLSLAVQAEQVRTQFVNQAQDRDNDANSYVLVARLDQPRFYIDLTGGYREGTARSSDSFFPPYRTGLYGYFVSYFLNRSLKLQGYGWRRPVNSLSLDNPYYFETRNGGGVSVGLGARMALQGFVLVGSNSYPMDVLVDGAPVRRVDDVTTFGGGFTFQIHRTTKLLVQGTSDQYRSDVPGSDRSIFRLSTALSFEGE
jgi:hypothetical protein